MADAIAGSLTSPGHVATLIVPSDCQWDPGGEARSRASSRRARKSRGAPSIHREGFARQKPATILLGGHALSVAGLISAARVASASGCKLMTETFTARIERGAGIPNPARLPYFPEQAIEALKGTQMLILAGAKSPVAFFGYQGLPSSLVPEDADAKRLRVSRTTLPTRSKRSPMRSALPRRLRCRRRRSRGPHREARSRQPRRGARRAAARRRYHHR